MAGKRPSFTENFSLNLSAIEALLGPEGAPAYQQPLDRLLDDIVPTLSRFPQCGRLFLVHSLQSTKATMLVNKLTRMLRKSEELREYILGDYLLLYLIQPRRIVFLAVKHHRQLSFDLTKFWVE
ncbi:MAG: type II toxin-antitoxin system RelE/ParE family toxin [Nitrospirae bacterium]|nr:type II toxin-antitoxin system RelE/ParE family toxin [Nitrospirota bacterium]